jgi:hypothetical protein
MTLQEVLADRPKVHAWTPGKLSYSGFADEFFEYIFKHIGPASATLETGAGISTVVFALSGARHLCVNPVAAEAERLKAYCDARGISTAAIDFQTVPSDQFFLTWKSHPLDLVLIDGGHGFPTPFIDWFYTFQSLKVGGVLIIDDTHLWTGAVLKDFLLTEPEWRLDDPRSPKTCIFIKTAECEPKDWWAQPYVVSRSDPDLKVPYPSGFRVAMDLARKGQYSLILKKTRRRLFGP